MIPADGKPGWRDNISGGGKLVQACPLRVLASAQPRVPPTNLTFGERLCYIHERNKSSNFAQATAGDKS